MCFAAYQSLNMSRSAQHWKLLLGEWARKARRIIDTEQLLSVVFYGNATKLSYEILSKATNLYS